MNRPRPATPPGHRADALAHQVEGYLLVHAERERAEREAAVLCARLPWLTTAQADDLTRHYTEQRLVLTRRTLQATVERAEALRREYEARYAALRRELLKRHAAGASLLLLTVGTVSATGVLLTR
ncbi:hypothetical protein AB0E75_32175 [Streptomyces griseoviridis]|uniref:Cytochrome C oxidase subunit I n=3 Tax=Streptomyces TaxID=1883 RepID=A0A918GI73_STRGD|nr:MULTISPECIES: hypothetical protein [Streptomyces]MDP9683083.1 hypothetical protein [Streptomyces griseoviridis]GGS36558.1 hypothetical protein GCM10010238_27340 [Streptomyces niveoruber]GGS89443.1 hypothetical protein GCM10010240_23510 [Streptomyces griseoviridis]GGU61395.1 hypothetical protein GCM10010259_60250 [Streptomyces daghestanicus]GHI32717.1 hypothetical protein Sdagh_44470 [Streptomyces daghestanicus]